MDIKKSRIVRRLTSLFISLRELRKNEVPYLTCYSLSAWPISNTPDLSDYPGLILIQYTSISEVIEATAYWKSHEAATGSSDLLQKNIGASRVLSNTYLREIATPKQKWWKRVTVGQWILYASSIIGAITILQTYFSKTFEAPDINVEIAGQEPLKFLPSDPVSFSLSITNRSREVQTKVDIVKKPTIKKPTATREQEYFDGLLRPAPIAPAATIQVPFLGRPLEEGAYTINVEVRAKTGSVRSWQNKKVMKAIEVWSPYPVVRKKPFVITGQGAYFNYVLLIGQEAPAGLKCRTIIENYPTVSMLNSNLPGASTPERLPDSKPAQGRVVSSFEFATARKFNSLQEYTFFVTLIGSDIKDLDWKAVNEATEIKCSRAKEG